MDLGPELDPTHLAVARWPRGWRPSALPAGFFGLVEDDDEVTLVCAEADQPEGALAVERGWRRITFAGPLPWEQVGFLADVAGRLAAGSDPVHEHGRVHHRPRPRPGCPGRPGRRRAEGRGAAGAPTGDHQPLTC